MRTVGLSPKVAVPAIALVGLGGVLLALGLILQEDTLVKAGVALLGAAGVQLPLGIKADPGNVVRDGLPGGASLAPPRAGG